jgi:predicted MFS family arabinose efflux permease
LPAEPGAVLDAATRRRLALLGATAGLGVANLYYAQPLAATMAQSLAVSASAIGACLMACQLGYALGMLLLVPLGDGRERRGLMVKTAAAASVALLLVATAPSYAVLLVTLALLGFASCLPQMSVPFAVSLVPERARGRAIGTVMAGLLTGILLSRTLSGIIAGALGWRWTFVCAAGIMAVLALVIRIGLPAQRPSEPLPWLQIIASMPRVLGSQPLLQRQALVGALGFAAFNAFWSTLSFQLAALGYGARTAGLFGVLGLAGVAAAPIVGRLSGRVHPTRINLVGLLSVALSFAWLSLVERSLLGIAVATVLLDAGAQATHLANQTIILGLDPATRNRTNALYMVSFFVGGSAGTLIAALAWERLGYGGVCLAGGALALAGLAPLAWSARAAHSTSERSHT